MGNSQQECQYARFITGTEEPGYSKHLVSFINEDPNVLTGPLNENVTTMIDAFNYQCTQRPDSDWLGKRDVSKEGKPYTWMTWRQAQEYVQALARGISKLGMMEDITEFTETWNFMGIYGKNRPEWVLTDLACSALGGTSVAFYDTLGPAAIEFVINQTQLTSITCESKNLAQLIMLKNQGKANSLKFLISMESYDISIEDDGKEAGIKIMQINEVIEYGRKHSKLDLDQFKPKPDDVYMFCYTSGTTGDPKAAMLSHKNILSSASSVLSVGGVQINETDTVISYLPLAHSFEKAIFAMSLVTGNKIGYYGGDHLKLLDDLAALKPTLFPSVPRLFNRIYDKIQAGMKEKSGFVQSMIRYCVNAKLENLQNKCIYEHNQYDALIFKKFKNLLGGRVKFMLTGSAPINPDTLNFLKICFCAPVHEGYGQTESSAASCLTSALDAKSGHVGGPLSCIRIKLRDIPEMEYLSTDSNPRGEICYQGNSIFKGYFKNEEKTREALSEDGWLYSGDVGMIFPNGSVKIIDRAKNIFKLAQGEYVAPEKLEGVYGQSAFVAQIFVHGESTESWLLAIVVAEIDQIKKAGIAKGIIAEGLEDAEIIASADVHKMILDNFGELHKMNKLNGIEKIKKIHLISEPFTQENDILTPTFKIKRNIARNVYKEKIDEIYKAGL